MERDKDIWIDEVLRSFEGKSVQHPRESLFNDILSGVVSIKKLSTKNLIYAVAAAITLILINVSVIQSSSSNLSSTNSIAMESEVNLISDYNLYDYE